MQSTATVIGVDEVMESLDSKRENTNQKPQKQKPDATLKVAPGLLRLQG
jgi:hypothetical protein